MAKVKITIAGKDFDCVTASSEDFSTGVKCDMCGELFNGEVFPVYNENHVVQPGLISGGCDMDIPDGEEQHP